MTKPTAIQIHKALNDARDMDALTERIHTLAPFIGFYNNAQVDDYIEKGQAALLLKDSDEEAFKKSAKELSPKNAKVGGKYQAAIIQSCISWDKEARKEKKANSAAEKAAKAEADKAAGDADPTVKVIPTSDGGTATVEGVKPAGVPKEKKPPKVKETHPCVCGCGAQVVGDFKMGHDARVKGWLLKHARGEIFQVPGLQPNILPESITSWDILGDKLTKWGIPCDTLEDGRPKLSAFGAYPAPKKPAKEKSKEGAPVTDETPAPVTPVAG